MKKYFIVTLFIINIYFVHSQDITQNEVVITDNINTQANIMGDAFIKSNYKIFVKYLHPKLIQVVGGEKKMINTLTKSINQAKSEGVTFLNVTFDNLTKIIKHKNELQCTISQNLTLMIKGEKTTTTSKLIALSPNNGKHWYFIDTKDKSITQMRQLLPNLSPKIGL